jgi:1-acyl-sn-glycerol-3-phosphate acyltransferase
MTTEGNPRLAKPSKRLMTLFHFYLRWYVGRHFHGLRIAHAERFPRQVEGPTIIYLNHPSWWDPLTGILIARHFLPQADHYAPMDEAALRRYRFFAKLGIFPVEPDTPRGGIQFVRRGTRILRDANSVLWLTPEGRFADPRPRPAVFKNGLASLLQRLPSAILVPLALEYVYWNERLPEILVNCGHQIRISDCGSLATESLNATLSSALIRAQDELAVLAIARDARRFEPILEGAAGIGAVYDLWRRMGAASAGEPYETEHGSIHRP